MNWMDMCFEELLVPNVTEVCLIGVFPSKKNANTTVFAFSCLDDVSSNDPDKYENVIWSHTVGTRLKPSMVADDAGNVSRKSINLAGVQLISLLLALDIHEDEIRNIMTMSRNDVVNAMQTYVGLVVTCPMTGRVKDKKGNTRIQFKFPALDYDSPEDLRDSLNAMRDSFGTSDLDMSVHTERVRAKMTRPDNAVTPVGAEDGDEII